MQNKFKLCSMVLALGMAFSTLVHNARADDTLNFDEEEFIVSESADSQNAQKESADAVAAYDMDGSLFEQITKLEQEKVLMQLEKERAQLDLELDRLAAEKIKLHMEIDTLSGRAEQQQQEFETEKAKLEAEAARLAREKENLEKPVDVTPVFSSGKSGGANSESKISDDYKLVNVFGVGNQLQATVSDLSTGQNKRLSVGKVLDGYTVKSISLDEGVVFVKDGVTENLNVSTNR